MTQQKINYIFSAVMVVLALILGWFGMTLPVAPVIPSPLPTPTPVDLSGIVQREEFALLQSQIEALDMAESFTVSGDSSYSTDCYQMQGGSTWVADSGCTWAVLDGGTLEVQSGATFDIAGYFSSTVSSITAGTGLITGNLTVSGTTDFVGSIASSAGAITVADTLNVGVDGTSYDVTLYSDTAGDYFLWDQSEEALTLIGTNGQDALNVDDGNVDVDDDLDVNGVTNLDVTNIAETLTLSALFRPGFVDVTITENYFLTPTVTAYALDSAGSVSMTLQAVGAEGQLLILMGDDNQTITINDVNVRTSTGNALTLGQYDTVAFVYQDSEWLELWLLANQ
jgi:hypothetical protein